MITWTATKEELSQMSDICDRAAKCIYHSAHTKTDLMMDLEAVHTGGCKLDLSRLLKFNKLDFLHDILGIIQHLDRETGQLNDCFMPRCSY